MGCDHDLAAKRKERVNRRTLVRFKAARLGLAASEAVGPRDCARSSDGAAAMDFLLLLLLLPPSSFTENTCPRLRPLLPSSSLAALPSWPRSLFSFSCHFSGLPSCHRINLASSGKQIRHFSKRDRGHDKSDYPAISDPHF